MACRRISPQKTSIPISLIDGKISLSGEQGKENYMAAIGLPTVHEDRSVRLTKRELEVLSLVIEGRSSKDVADALYVSKRTVDFHLANIYDKLQVSNRVQAFRRATRLGLIPLEATLLGS